MDIFIVSISRSHGVIDKWNDATICSIAGYCIRPSICRAFGREMVFLCSSESPTELVLPNNFLVNELLENIFKLVKFWLKILRVFEIVQTSARVFILIISQKAG